MTILQEYRRERRNYMRRVNRQVKQGFMVNPIPIPKKPTRASINRLKAQTAKVIQESSVLVDLITGESYDKTRSKKSKKKRSEILKQNKLFLKLNKFDQHLSRQAGKIFRASEKELTLTPTQSYETIIDNWYSAIESFRPDIYMYLSSKTNELIEGKSAEIRRQFAYVYNQNPDVFPEAGDSDRAIINAKFEQIRNLMRWSEESEAYKDFISMFDEVEYE